MKSLRVVVNTHKHPWRAMAVIECLRNMASGRHGVRYVLAFDTEDVATKEFVEVMDCMWPLDVTVDMRPRPDSVQDCWNRNMQDPSLADIWLVMPDDVFCMTPDWDDLIVQTMAAAPVPDLAVIGWNDPANKDQFTVPIVAAGWLKAIAPAPLFDPRFKFWMADTAVSETWSYVFGMRAPCPPYLKVANKPNAYNPMLVREGGDAMWDLYTQTRADRIATAARVREAYGLPRPRSHDQYVEAWTLRDADGRKGTAELVERLREKVPA